MPSDSYVYALFDSDGIPRYIGKGKGSRWRQHRSEGTKSFVADAIRRLGDVPAIKLRVGLAEHEAYAIEQALIIAIGMAPDGPLVNKTAKGSGPNSRQVKKWHAAKTPEERKAHMAPAIAAALAAKAANPKHSRTKEYGRDNMRRYRAAKPPNENTAARRAAHFKHCEVCGIEFFAKTHAKGRRFCSLSCSSLRQTPEQYAEKGRKAAAVRTKELCHSIAKKRIQTLGPERVREICMKGAASNRRKAEERIPLGMSREEWRLQRAHEANRRYLERHPEVRERKNALRNATLKAQRKALKASSNTAQCSSSALSPTLTAGPALPVAVVIR